MEYLKEIFEKHGFLLNDRQVRQFKQFYDMLVEKNKVMNLTAITDYKEVIVKHFLDSVYLAKYRDLSGDISVIDVGTGAGFPGIPLKIVFPEIRLVLLDSLNKRIVFLQEVIQALSLENVEAIHGRAEEIARKAQYREQFDYCVSRAVANLNSLSEICLPFVKEGGQFISYKSMKGIEEVKLAERAIGLFGGSVGSGSTGSRSVGSGSVGNGNIGSGSVGSGSVGNGNIGSGSVGSGSIGKGAYEDKAKASNALSVIHFVLEEDSAGVEPMNRNFICVDKVKKTPKKYPRKPGTPFKEPIS